MRLEINYITHFFLFKGEPGLSLSVDYQRVGDKVTFWFCTEGDRKISLFQIRGDLNRRYFNENLDEFDVQNIIRFIMYNNTIDELNDLEFYCDDFGADLS